MHMLFVSAILAVLSPPACIRDLSDQEAGRSLMVFNEALVTLATAWARLGMYLYRKKGDLHISEREPNSCFMRFVLSFFMR